MLFPLKFAAVSAIAGAIILMLSTVLHPFEADPGDAAAAFAEYADDNLWVATHLSQLLGIALMFMGLVGLSDSLSNQRTAWLAKLGVFFGVAALATTAVLQAVDGVALKVMTDAWTNAPADQEQITFQAAMSVRQIEIGVASLVALLFGTVFVLFGCAITQSEAYPTWLGWLGIIGGLGTIAGGLTTAVSGFSTTAMTIAAPFDLILVIWMAVIGILMWRRAVQRGRNFV